MSGDNAENKRGATVSFSKIVWIRRIGIVVLLLVTIILGYGGPCTSGGGGSSGSSGGTAPNAPTILQATVNKVPITLTWSLGDVTNEDGIEIERYLQIVRNHGAGPQPPVPPFTVLKVVGPDTTMYYDDDTLRSSNDLDPLPHDHNIYHYRIRAYNAYGYSGYSNEAFATTGTNY